MKPLAVHRTPGRFARVALPIVLQLQWSVAALAITTHGVIFSGGVSVASTDQFRRRGAGHGA